MSALCLSLLILFQIKHFIADYPLQNSYMLGKFKDRGWVAPLSLHCGVHAAITMSISALVLGLEPNGLVISIQLASIDFIFHFIMDRIKASPKMLGRYDSLSKEQAKGLFEALSLAKQGVGHKELDVTSRNEVTKINKRFTSNKYFWWSLGADQMVHHLTDIAIIYLLLSKVSEA